MLKGNVPQDAEPNEDGVTQLGETDATSGGVAATSNEATTSGSGVKSQYSQHHHPRRGRLSQSSGSDAGSHLVAATSSLGDATGVVVSSSMGGGGGKSLYSQHNNRQRHTRPAARHGSKTGGAGSTTTTERVAFSDSKAAWATRGDVARRGGKNAASVTTGDGNMMDGRDKDELHYDDDAMSIPPPVGGEEILLPGAFSVAAAGPPSNSVREMLEHQQQRSSTSRDAAAPHQDPTDRLVSAVLVDDNGMVIDDNEHDGVNAHSEWRGGDTSPNDEGGIVATAKPVSPLVQYWQDHCLLVSGCAIFVIVVVVVAVTVGVVASQGGGEGGGDGDSANAISPTLTDPPGPTSSGPTSTVPPSLSPSLFPTDMPTKRCGVTEEERDRLILELLESKNITSQAEIEADDIHHNMTFQWITREDTRYVCPDDKTLVQRYILAHLYFALDGPAWKNCPNALCIAPREVNFLAEASECDWTGVDCDTDTRVVKRIQLGNKGLNGPMPQSIPELTGLEELDLSRNAIWGLMPQKMDKLLYLTFLDLSQNDLNGTLPESLYNITSLRELVMERNNFGGPISENIGDLHQLEIARLDSNVFFGPIPQSLQKLPNLKLVTLHDNYLTGNLQELCQGNISAIIKADCEEPNPQVACDCCGRTDCYDGKLTPSPTSVPTAVPSTTPVPTVRPPTSPPLSTPVRAPTNEPVQIPTRSPVIIWRPTILGPTILRPTLRTRSPSGVIIIGRPTTRKGRCNNILITCRRTTLPPATPSPVPPTSVTPSPTKSSSPTPIPTVPERYMFIQTILEEEGLLFNFTVQDTPQYSAYHWLSFVDTFIPMEDLVPQRYVLSVLYFATNGNNWSRCSNDATKSTCEVGMTRFLQNVTECEWMGLRCNTDGTIKSIDIQDNGLNGVLPDEEISFLYDLERLSLPNNGELQVKTMTYFGDYLTKLETLDLSGTNIGGPIPGEIYDITSLQTLHLHGCKLVGTISPSFGNLTSLVDVRLHGNELNGTLPPEGWDNLRALELLTLHENDIVGQMPESACSLAYDRGGRLENLWADCGKSSFSCDADCCTVCYPVE